MNNKNDELRNKNYNEILKLLESVRNSQEWKKVPSIMSQIYNGRDIYDIDYIFIYYNQKLDKAIRFIINYEYKIASVQNEPLEELHISDLDDVKKKIK